MREGTREGMRGGDKERDEGWHEREGMGMGTGNMFEQRLRVLDHTGASHDRPNLARCTHFPRDFLSIVLAAGYGLERAYTHSVQKNGGTGFQHLCFACMFLDQYMEKIPQDCLHRPLGITAVVRQILRRAC